VPPGLRAYGAERARRAGVVAHADDLAVAQPQHLRPARA
jgi:hypothetical protein